MLGLTCDCLIDCGDDPNLRTGKAKPCPKRREFLEREAIRQQKQASADALCKKFWVATVLDLVEVQDWHIRRLQDALMTMLGQFTKAHSSLKDSEALLVAHAALKAVERGDKTMLQKGGAL